MYEYENNQKYKGPMVITRTKKHDLPDNKRYMNFGLIPFLSAFSCGEEYFIKIPLVIAAPTIWWQRSAEEWDVHGAMADAADWDPYTGEIVGFKVPYPSMSLMPDSLGINSLHMANAISLTDFRRQIFIAPDTEVVWFPHPKVVINGGEI